MAQARALCRQLLQRLAVLGPVLVVVGVLVAGSLPQTALSAEISNRSLRMSNPTAGAQNVEYLVEFNVVTATTLGSIKLEFCSNTPLYTDSCVAPAGFDAGSVVLGSQTGATGFAIATFSTANEIILTRPPAAQPAGQVRYNLTTITNPSNDASFYVRLLTYSSSDASGPSTDQGGLALDTEPGFGVQAEVPPYIIFCVGENIAAYDCSSASEAFSDVGNLTPSVTSATQSQMVAASNAQYGYIITVAGTTMTSGNNVINAMPGGPAVKGTSQFGLNLRANTTPSVGQDVQGPGTAAPTSSYDLPNQFRFNPGDILASAFEPNDFRKYTVSYIVNVPPEQPGGVYSTTLTYVCLANF